MCLHRRGSQSGIDLRSGTGGQNFNCRANGSTAVLHVSHDKFVKGLLGLLRRRNGRPAQQFMQDPELLADKLGAPWMSFRDMATRR